MTSRWASLWLFAACAASPTDAPIEAIEAVEAIADPDTLDVAGSRAHLAPAPPNADPERVVVLDEPLGDLPIGYRLLEAHRVGDGWLVLQTNHELWWRDDEGARRLEHDVEAPLSVRDRRVAFARGTMPDFEIVTLDLDADFVRPLTEGYAPAWSPALGPRGEVVFVSGRSGAPALYRVRPGEAPVRLHDEGAFPSWVDAPTHDGVELRFRDERGVAHTLRVRPADPSPPRVDEPPSSVDSPSAAAPSAAAPNTAAPNAAARSAASSQGAPR